MKVCLRLNQNLASITRDHFSIDPNGEHGLIAANVNQRWS